MTELVTSITLTPLLLESHYTFIVFHMVHDIINFAIIIWAFKELFATILITIIVFITIIIDITIIIIYLSTKGKFGCPRGAHMDRPGSFVTSTTA